MKNLKILRTSKHFHFEGGSPRISDPFMMKSGKIRGWPTLTDYILDPCEILQQEPLRIPTCGLSQSDLCCPGVARVPLLSPASTECALPSSTSLSKCCPAMSAEIWLQPHNSFDKPYCGRSLLDHCKTNLLPKLGRIPLFSTVSATFHLP